MLAAETKREQPRIGSWEVKTLTFGKENHSHGHVDVSYINFHSFVLGIHEDGKQRKIDLGDGQYTLKVNSPSFYVSATSKFWIVIG